MEWPAGDSLRLQSLLEEDPEFVSWIRRPYYHAWSYKGLSEGPIVYASRRSDAAAHLELLYKAGASPNAITIGQNGIVYTVLMTSICRFFNWA